jgi:putative membrane protein
MNDPALQNSNIDLAREQTILASERTFLSWIRTGLAMVGAGIVVIRFVLFENSLEQLLIVVGGKVLIFWGVIIFLLSLFDFRRVFKIKNVPMPQLTNVFVNALVGSLVIISLFLLFAA